MANRERHFTNDAGRSISVVFTHRARLALEQDGIPYGKVAERILTAEGLEKILLHGAQGFQRRNPTAQPPVAPWTLEGVRDFLDDAVTFDVVQFLDGAYAAAMGGGKTAPAATAASPGAEGPEAGKAPAAVAADA